jgi:hypothetical protein
VEKNNNSCGPNLALVDSSSQQELNAALCDHLQRTDSTSLRAKIASSTTETCRIVINKMAVTPPEMAQHVGTGGQGLD